MAETDRQNCHKTLAFDVALIVLFFFACVAGVSHHGMWRDEVYTWTIAANSSSFSDLWANRLYEGHPITWLFMVYLLSHVAQDPFWMQMLHVTIATISVSIFVVYAPFGRLPKSLFVFSYFPLIEYGLVTRNYGLGVLFAFAFCAAYKRPTRILAFLFLCLMANTNVYAAITAAALATLPILQAWIGSDRKERGMRKDVLVGMAAFCAAACLSFYQMKPPSDLIVKVEWGRLLDLRLAVSSCAAIWNAYLPVPDVLSINFWNVNIWHRLYATFGSAVPVLVLCTSFLILAATAMCLSRTPFVAVSYVLGNVWILTFIILFGPGQLRHHGYLFVLFVACCWTSERFSEGENGRFYAAGTRIASWIQNHRGSLVTVLFAVHFLAGGYAFAQHALHPWSCVPSAAEWIKKKPERPIIAVYPDYVGNGIRAFAGERRIFFLEMNSWQTKALIDLRIRERTSCETILARIAGLLAESREEVIFACTEPVTCARENLELKLVCAFDDCIRRDERVYLYICRLAD
jgi:hypothetical protein